MHFILWRKKSSLNYANDTLSWKILRTSLRLTKSDMVEWSTIRKTLWWLIHVSVASSIFIHDKHVHAASSKMTGNAQLKSLWEISLKSPFEQGWQGIGEIPEDDLSACWIQFLKSSWDTLKNALSGHQLGAFTTNLSISSKPSSFIKFN